MKIIKANEQMMGEMMQGMPMKTVYERLRELESVIKGMAHYLEIIDTGEEPFGVRDKITEPKAYVEDLETIHREMERRVREAMALINSAEGVIETKMRDRGMLD